MLRFNKGVVYECRGVICVSDYWCMVWMMKEEESRRVRAANTNSRNSNSSSRQASALSTMCCEFV